MKRQLAILVLCLVPVSASAQEMYRDSVACGLTRAAFVLAAVDVCAQMGARPTLISPETGTVTAEVLTRASGVDATRLIVAAATDGRTVHFTAYMLRPDGRAEVPMDQPPIIAALRRICVASPAE